MKTILVFFVALIIGSLAGYYWGYDVGYEKATKTQTAKPAQVNQNTESSSDLIVVSNLKPNQVITSPLTVNGEARGTWFFEANFPVYLYDANDKEIAVAVAQAEGEWMTEDFVPFSVTLEFEKPDTKDGELVLKKDNPSGLPEHENEIRVPVKFE